MKIAFILVDITVFFQKDFRSLSTTVWRKMRCEFMLWWIVEKILLGLGKSCNERGVINRLYTDSLILQLFSWTLCWFEGIAHSFRKATTPVNNLMGILSLGCWPEKVYLSDLWCYAVRKLAKPGFFSRIFSRLNRFYGTNRENYL